MLALASLTLGAYNMYTPPTVSVGASRTAVRVNDAQLTLSPSSSTNYVDQLRLREECEAAIAERAAVAEEVRKAKAEKKAMASRIAKAKADQKAEAMKKAIRIAKTEKVMKKH